MALAAEHESKNWVKILIKFLLWFAFLISVYFLFKGTKVTQSLRIKMLFASLVIFGIIMGSDSSPMGTVKDAIHLYGSAGAVFPPRFREICPTGSISFSKRKRNLPPAGHFEKRVKE